MKKIYSQPEWKVSLMEEEDVITASYSYDSNDIFNSDADAWEW